MDERRTGSEGGGEDTASNGEPGAGSAGPANTPSFERGAAAQQPTGRPPSHRELEQGTLGDESDERARMEGIAAAATDAAEQAGHRARNLAREVEERAGGALDRAGQRLNRQKDRAAEGIRRGARELHETAESYREGPRARRVAGRLAHRASHTAEDAADYIEGTQLEDIRAALEHQVRERPLQTLLIAGAAGWLVGKILR